MEKNPAILKDIIYDEDDLYEREEVVEEKLHFITFRLAREWYGVNITRVKEIIKMVKVTYLPSSPEHIAGIVSLRGNILSVTDLKAIFGLPYEAPSEKTRIIAIEAGIFETGLLVDEVVEPIEIPVSKIEPPLSTLHGEQGKYVEGQCWSDNRLVALLSVEKILEKRT